MRIPFKDFFERLKKYTSINTQSQLSEALGVHRSAVTQAKLRNSVPQKWILVLARHFSLSPDWLEFGVGRVRNNNSNEIGSATNFGAQSFQEDVIVIPKIAATISAGGGSFEVGANTVLSYPFPVQWLSRKGNPLAMMFMDVIGNSMEPTIMDGDMVLVDQAGTNLITNKIFVVGVEDTLYIKRVEIKENGVVLHSDNPDYCDIELYGDELSTFRVLGKVVWLCRDCLAV